MSGFTRIEFVVVLLIAVGLAAILIPAVNQVRNAKGPHGEKIPSAAPNESNRMTHPSGLSMIAPPNWDSVGEFSDGPPKIHIAVRGGPGRIESIILVHACDPPDTYTLKTFKSFQFQSHPAYERMGVDGQSAYDSGVESTYDLYVNYGEAWWHVSFVIDEELTVLPNEIRGYIDTIVFP